ncbi:MAG: PilZ domain-containing protein [Roseburia sp.]|nr:PilZ domain-containing protein [Roseburia sp.]
MELTDLEEGDKVVLEIQWSERPYQINTTVMGTSDSAVYIKPFMYRGTVLDLASARFRNMIFNLYGVDKRENTRLVWRNVLIETKTYKDESCYSVHTSNSRKFPTLSERRQNKRMLLDKQGSIIFGEEEKQVTVMLHDVSDNGISFFVQSGMELPEKMIKIEFEDAVRGHGFHILVDGRLVRRVPKGEEELVGCRITQTNHDFLAYICLKRIEFSVQAKRAREEQLAEQKASEAKTDQGQQEEKQQTEQGQQMEKQIEVGEAF